MNKRLKTTTNHNQITRIADYNEDYQLNGFYELYNENQQLVKKCIYKENQLHGEFRYSKGIGLISYLTAQIEDDIIVYHEFYCRGKLITLEVKEIVDDIKNITDEERMIIKLAHGIDCL